MSDFWTPYFKDVLGVQYVQQPENPELIEDEIRHHFVTRTGHYPEIQSFDLIVVQVSKKMGSFFSSEVSDLFEKMKTALKISENASVLELETDSEFKLDDLKKIFQFNWLIVFKENPDSWDCPAQANILITYSPEILLEKPELKRAAWSQLQKLLGKI